MLPVYGMAIIRRHEQKVLSTSKLLSYTELTGLRAQFSKNRRIPVKHTVRLMTMLLLLFMIMPSITHADPIPPKDGLMQDLAGMMSKEDWPRVEAAAKGTLYTFYVLSIESLEGEDPSTFATDVYNSWKLTTDDVLLLLSKQDRIVEMNFNNRSLQDKIDALPDDYNGDGDIQSKLSEFVDRLFIPNAKEGRFADAAISLIEATNQLKKAETLPVPAPNTGAAAQGGSKPNQPLNNNGSAPKTEPSAPLVNKEANSTSPTKPLSSGAIALLVAAIAGILLLIAAGIILLRHNRKRKLETQAPTLMAAANQSLERIRPYTTLYQGETLQTAEQIEKELNVLLIQLQATLVALRAISWLQVLKPSIGLQLKQYAAELMKQEQTSEALAKRIQAIEETEKAVSTGLISEQSQLGQVIAVLQQEQTSRSWSLTHLTERSSILSAEFKAIDDMDAFDPLQASGRFTEAQAALDRLEQDVTAVSTYAEVYRQFPQHSNEARGRFEQIVKQHSLKLVRIDPYARLEEARLTSEQLYVQLQAGNIPDVERHAERMRQQLTEAEQMVQRLADLQVKNAADIELIVKQLSGYVNEDHQLRAMAAHVKPLYRTKHWQEEWEAYLGILHVINDTEQRLIQVRTWCQLDVQEYEEARVMLDQLFINLKSRDTCATHFADLVRKLDQQLEESKRYAAAGTQAATSASQLINRHGLVPKWSQVEQELHQLNAGTQRMLAEPPYDVELLYELCQRYAREAEAYLKDVERTVVLKQNAERRIAEMERFYQSTYQRTRGKINVSRYRNDFDSAQHSARQLLASGQYDAAAKQAATISGIISAMSAAYEMVLAEERREEEERRRAEQQRQQMMNNHSSGGSSWGGSSGSNSSGGSSFNNNSNSSGGSKW